MTPTNNSASSRRSSMGHAMPQPVTGSANSSWPCASATSPSTTSSVNWPRPDTPSALMPSPSCCARKASRDSRAVSMTNGPRRLDRQPRPRPTCAPLSLEPRSFRTRLGGFFFFVPLLKDIRLTDVLRQADLPGSQMIPAEQALRSLLALKLVGNERKSHVMDLVCDRASPCSPASTSSPNAPTWPAIARASITGPSPPHGSLVRRDPPGRAAAGRFLRPRLPHRTRQHPGGAVGEALHFQPQPHPERRPGFPGPRRRRPGPLLRQRWDPQRPEGNRRSSVSSTSGKAALAVHPANWCSIRN